MIKNLSVFVAATIITAQAFSCMAGELLIKNGQKIAFLGDSITARGFKYSDGYVQLVVNGLKANGIKVSPIPAGVSGNTSEHMLARIDKDVISQKPDFMTLSCGVNDVWHGAKGVQLDKYKENIASIVDKAKAAGIKVVILTATMIGEGEDNSNNKKLALYNEFLRDFARERKLPLADLNADMLKALKAAKEKNAPKSEKDDYLTVDGVHMAPSGDRMMAEGVLRALGLDDSQIAIAQKAWLKIPASDRSTVNNNAGQKGKK